MKSRERYEDINEPILVRIESGIGFQLEEGGKAEVVLNVEESQAIMSFLIETLFARQEAELRGQPIVEITFVKSNVVNFCASLEMIRPLRTKLLVSGMIQGNESGMPKLVSNSVKVRIEKRFAALALSAFGLEEIVERTLDDLPGTIKQVLPPRLARLGFSHKIGNVGVYFEEQKVVARVSRDL